MLEEFLTELRLTFPEIAELEVYESHFHTIKESNPEIIVHGYISAMKPYKKKLDSRDESLILNNDNPFLKKLNVSEVWTDELSQNTKDAIWEYLQQLHIRAMAVDIISDDLLSSIGEVAQKLQTQIEQDPEAFQDMMNSVIGHLGHNKSLFGKL